MLFLALISVVAASDGKWKDGVECYGGDLNILAFRQKLHASKDAAMTECKEACDNAEVCHFAEFNRDPDGSGGPNSGRSSCKLMSADCLEYDTRDATYSVYVKSGNLDAWRKEVDEDYYDDEDEDDVPAADQADGSSGSAYVIPSGGYKIEITGSDGAVDVGIYEKMSDVVSNGKPVWKHKDKELYLWYFVLSEETNVWSIGTSIDSKAPTYFSDDSGNPPENSGWFSNAGLPLGNKFKVTASPDDVPAGNSDDDAAAAAEADGSSSSAEWNVIADGTKGEAGCSIPEYAIWETHGNIPLEDCKGKCQNFAFMSHHTNDYCSCLSACSLTRPAIDFSVRALVYERQALTDWPEHGGCENCRCGGSTNDSPAESQGACEARAQGSGHEYYSYTANNGYCLTVAACEDIVTGTGWPWKIFKKPAVQADGSSGSGDSDDGWTTGYVVVRHRDDNSCECLWKDDSCLNDDVCFEDATCDDHTVVRHRDDNSCECLPKTDSCLDDDVCFEDATCDGYDYLYWGQWANDFLDAIEVDEIARESDDGSANDGLGQSLEEEFAIIKSLETLREWCKLSWDNCFACGGNWKGSTELGFCRKGRLQNKRLSRCRSFNRDPYLCEWLGCKPKMKRNGKYSCKNRKSSSGVSFDHLE